MCDLQNLLDIYIFISMEMEVSYNKYTNQIKCNVDHSYS